MKDNALDITLFIQPFQNLGRGGETLLETSEARIDAQHRGVLGLDQRRDILARIFVRRHADRCAATGTTDEIQRARRIGDTAVENHLEFGSAAGRTFGFCHEIAPGLDRMAGYSEATGAQREGLILPNV